MWAAIRLLHLRRLRRQSVRVVVSAMSVAAGVALAVSVVIVQTSVTRSLDEAGRRLAGPAPLRVVGPAARGGLDESVLGRIRSVPGVSAAIPAVQAISMVDAPGRAGRFVLVLGVDCSAPGPVRCPAGEGPWLSRGLADALAGSGTLRTDAGEIPLAAAPALDLLDRVGGNRVVAMPLPVAQQRFARAGSLDVVYVVPAAGATIDALRSRLAQAVGPWNTVLAAGEAAPGAEAGTGTMLPLFAVLALFALAIGGVLVRNTVVLSLEERRRELAVVGALGASPWLLVGGTLAEAAVLGAVGGVGGALAAVALAHPLVGSISRVIERVAGVGLRVHAPPASFMLAVGLGVGVAVLATWRPARRAAAADIAGELADRRLADDAAPRPALRRTIAAIAVAVAGLDVCYLAQRGGALSAWQPPTSQVAFLVVALALVAAVGSVAPPLFRAVGDAVAGWAPAPVRLGFANLVRVPARTRVMVVAAATAVGVAVCIASTAAAVRVAITDNITAGVADGVAVTTLPLNNTINVDGRLDPGALARLKQLPGVSAVERRVALAAAAGGERFGVEGIEDTERLRSAALPLLHGTADPARFRAGGVLIGPALARRTGVRPGGTIRLPGRTGMVDVRVQGIWQDGDFNGTKVTMPLSMVERIWGPQPPLLVIVRPTPGTTPVELAHRIEGARLAGEVRARPAAEFAAEVAAENAKLFAPFWALQRGMLAVAFLAVLFSLLLAIIQRRRELAVLGAIGMRPGELARMVLFEGVAVALAATVLATAVSLGMIEAMREVFTVVIGYRDPFRVDWLTAIRYGAVAVVVLAAAAAWPAIRSSRTDVVDGLRYE